MTDWIEHNGGPQPVDDDVEVEVLPRRVVSPCKQVGAARFRNWKHRPGKPDLDIIGYRILNQHLIDAKQAEIDVLRDDLETWQSVFPHVMPDRLKSDQQLAEEDVAAKIDAARLEGIRLGLEAAAKVADLYSNKKVVSHIRWLQPDIIAAIQKPDTIAKEAQRD